jgi:hypothetical protein
MGISSAPKPSAPIIEDSILSKPSAPPAEVPNSYSLALVPYEARKDSQPTAFAPQPVSQNSVPIVPPAHQEQYWPRPALPAVDQHWPAASLKNSFEYPSYTSSNTARVKVGEALASAARAVGQATSTVANGIGVAAVATAGAVSQAASAVMNDGAWALTKVAGWTKELTSEDTRDYVEGLSSGIQGGSFVSVKSNLNGIRKKKLDVDMTPYIKNVLEEIKGLKQEYLTIEIEAKILNWEKIIVALSMHQINHTCKQLAEQGRDPLNKKVEAERCKEVIKDVLASVDAHAKIESAYKNLKKLDQKLFGKDAPMHRSTTPFAQVVLNKAHNPSQDPGLVNPVNR